MFYTGIITSTSMQPFWLLILYTLMRATIPWLDLPFTEGLEIKDHDDEWARKATDELYVHNRLHDLDLDSTRIQVDTLGHTSTPFSSVLSCHLHFLPGDSHPQQVLVDCAPSVCARTTWTSLKPRNLPVQRLSTYALVIHSYHMSKPAESSFTEYVVHTVLSSSNSDLFICYSVLPGNAQDAISPI